MEVMSTTHMPSYYEIEPKVEFIADEKFCHGCKAPIKDERGIFYASFVWHHRCVSSFEKFKKRKLL